MKKLLRSQLERYAFLFVLISINGHGQVQIGQDIMGFDDLGLGETTSLSADGNTVAIGCWAVSWYDPNSSLAANGIYGNNGSVRVYTKKVSAAVVTWEQLGDIIFPEPLDIRQFPGQRSGRTVQLSHDGSVLAIGTRGNRTTDTGYARVFKKIADAQSPGGFKWEQIGGDINGTQAGGRSGFDVSLSGDGNVVAIGTPFFDVAGLADAGLVRVYKRDASDNWVQLGSDIEGLSEGERLGISVGISDDGNTLAMTGLHLGPAYRDENNFLSYDSKGLITRVYQNVNGLWVLLGDFIGNEGTVNREDRGGYVRLTGDGNTLATTSWADGSVRVYQRDANDNWTLKGNELNGGFGWGIALSDDANTLAVGTPDASLNNLTDVGSVRIYKYSSNNTWEVVTGFNGEHRGHNLGHSNSLSLSADGSVLAMGASDYGFDNTSGFNLARGRAGMYHIGLSGVSIQGAPAAVNSIDPFEVTFKFDRGVTDFNEGDIVVANATVDNFTAVSASTYTATITPASICGDDDNISINVPASSAFDINSNMPNLAAQEVVVKTGVVAVAQDLTVQLAPNGLATISPEDVDNGSGHNCDNGGAVMLSLDRDTFTCSDVGTPVTVTLTAASGNQTDTSTAVVTVENNTNGLVAVAKDMTVQLDAEGMASIGPGEINNGSGSGCRNAANPISLSLDRNVFTCDDMGQVTVTLTVGQGTETATTTAVVTVEEYWDNLVAVAKDMTVRLDADGLATISPGDVDGGSAYGCGNLPELSLDRTMFTCDDVGDPVTVTLTAAHGDSSDTATATVTVEEYLGNLAAIAQGITVQLDANGRATISPADVDDGSSYGCNSIPELSLDIDTFDCDDVGSPVTVTLTAAHGDNSDTATATVTVEEYLGNLAAIAQGITVQLDANGRATISPGDVDDGSSYGCNSIPELSLDIDTFDCDDVGSPVTVTLTAAHGNNSDTATATVTVEANGNCELGPLADFNRGFSPNGDGIGDTLVIEGLEHYRNNVVKIYDLSQRLLFSAHYGGPGDAWDGTDKNGMVPVGSYVCVIDYNEPGLGHEAKMIYVNY